MSDSEIPHRRPQKLSGLQVRVILYPKLWHLRVGCKVVSCNLTVDSTLLSWGFPGINVQSSKNVFRETLKELYPATLGCQYQTVFWIENPPFIIFQCHLKLNKAWGAAQSPGLDSDALWLLPPSVSSIAAWSSSGWWVILVCLPVFNSLPLLVEKTHYIRLHTA